MRKHNYVIGFSGEKQVAYGKKVSGEVYDRTNSYVELLTRKEAEKEIKTLLKPSYLKAKRFIYKLVEIYTID